MRLSAAGAVGSPVGHGYRLPGQGRPHHYPVSAGPFGGKQAGVGASDEGGEVLLLCGLNNPKAGREAG